MKSSKQPIEIWTKTGCFINLNFLVFLLTFFPIQALPPLPITIKWSQFTEVLSDGVEKYTA